MLLFISSSLFVSSAPPSHALIHADLQGFLSAAELPPEASPSALPRLLLFKFSLKQQQTLLRKHSTPGEEPVHLHADFLVQALPCLPLKAPRCCRSGNSDAVLACIAPNKEYQTGTNHKSHLGKNKSSRHMVRRQGREHRLPECDKEGMEKQFCMCTREAMNQEVLSCTSV